MSLVFVIIVERDVVYFGSVHWRYLDNPRPFLEKISLDGGYIFYDKNNELLLDSQSCVSIDRISF